MKVCIAIETPDVYSETFIRDHVTRLPCETLPLYGEWPTSKYNGQGIVPPVFRALARGVPALCSYRDKFLSSFLKKMQVDVVMAEYATAAVPLMSGCRNAAVPLVVHFHGYDAYNKEILKKYEADYKRLFQMAGGVVVGSRAMEQHLLALGAKRETLFYNPCGVDGAEFTPADPAANPPVFVAVGRFVDKKAPHLTLLAFERVLKECPEARLVMIGEGPLWDACKQMSASLRLCENVEFPGKLEPRAVADVLKRGRAFVQHSLTTSYGDSEGTAITILEAGATGLPVVSTRHGGIQDTVVHDATGFLVSERDVTAMADYMVRLAQNPALAAEMGARARAHVTEKFSMQRSIENLYSILQRAALAGNHQWRKQKV